MGTSLRAVEVAAGLVINLAIFYDLFQTVVLPRPAVRKVQLARYLIRPGWAVWRTVGRRIKKVDRSEGFMAGYGPLSLLGLFIVWALALTVGYGLLVAGLGDEFRPALNDFATALYVSATTLVPLSYGDFVPEQAFARLTIIAESATGVAIAALAITLLFSLYESFRDREEAVVALDALAGAPPSGVQILEASANRGLRPKLGEMFDEWRKWSAMVLESHLAYPLLVYFRSSHDNEAWVNSLGAMMDASALLLTTVDDEAEGSAQLMFTIGLHLVEDLELGFFTEGNQRRDRGAARVRRGRGSAEECGLPPQGRGCVDPLHAPPREVRHGVEPHGSPPCDPSRRVGGRPVLPAASRSADPVPAPQAGGQSLKTFEVGVIGAGIHGASVASTSPPAGSWSGPSSRAPPQAGPRAAPQPSAALTTPTAISPASPKKALTCFGTSATSPAAGAATFTPRARFTCTPAPTPPRSMRRRRI